MRNRQVAEEIPAESVYAENKKIKSFAGEVTKDQEHIFYPEICGQSLVEEDPFHVAGATNHPEKNPTGHWPWMASFGVLYKDSRWEHQCGATLISNKHFITAAHCLNVG